MAQVESNDPPSNESSQTAILSQDHHPTAIHESQEQSIEGDSSEQTKDQEMGCREFTAPDPPSEEADDDVMFIFSVPRSKKQQRRILDPFYRQPIFNPQLVQSLEGCHIEDNDIKPSQLQGSSPSGPSAGNPQVQDLQLPPIDPTTEPNFAAMQDIPLPASSLQWWNDPDSSFQLEQANTSGWMESQHDEISPCENNMNEVSVQGRLDSVDDQISPRTKPETILQSNNTSKVQSTNARELARKLNDPMQYQPPSYFSTPMPAWSKNWTGVSDTDSPFSRPRMPSSTPPSLVRNNFRPNSQQRPHPHMYGQPIFYSPRHGEPPGGLNLAQPSQLIQQHHDGAGYVSTGAVGDFRAMETHISRSPVMCMPPQRQTVPPNQRPDGFQSTLQSQTGDSAHVAQPLPRVENPNDVLRRPSLYKIPPWSSLAVPVVSVPSNIHSRFHPTTPEMMQTNTPVHQTRGDTSTLRQSPQPSTAQPSSEPDPTPRRRGARKFTPNLIVDIAETCQKVFPFEMIAERHSVPLQKVFDTFSAIIQLPLLRNADDKRRHGSLGKRRMREFREAKKKMAEEMRGMKRSGEELGTGGEKRARKEQPLLRCAVMNNSRERDV